MKKFFRRIAGFLVTAYANKLYKKAVKAADLAHIEKGTRVYVVSSWGDISRLVILDRDNFRRMKRELHINGGISSVMEGAWYYTPDRAEKNGLPEIDKKARRVAFTRHLLDKAGLLEK